jgi:hypothetical protein
MIRTPRHECTKGGGHDASHHSLALLTAAALLAGCATESRMSSGNPSG